MKSFDEIAADALLIFGGSLNDGDIQLLKEVYVELAKEEK